jgi:hypothetical protein
VKAVLNFLFDLLYDDDFSTAMDSHPKRRTQIEGICEQSAEENIWTQETGSCWSRRKLNNEQLSNRTEYYWFDKIKSDEMSGRCSTHGKMRNA